MLGFNYFLFLAPLPEALERHTRGPRSYSRGPSYPSAGFSGKCGNRGVADAPSRVPEQLLSPAAAPHLARPAQEGPAWGRQQSCPASPLGTEALSWPVVEGKAIVRGSFAERWNCCWSKIRVLPRMEALKFSPDLRPAVCWCPDLRRSSLTRAIAANGEIGEGRRGERAAARLSHSRALTGSLLTQHRPPRQPSSPFPHADSSTISSSFGPARSIASPRRLHLRLRAPRTDTAVGGISGRGRGRLRQSPQRRGGAESLASLRSLWHREVRIGSARGSPALCLSAVEPLLPAYSRGG